MLFNIDNGQLKQITRIPFKKDYDQIVAKLKPSELTGIFDFIREKVSGEEITVSSFIPGHDWAGTPLECLYYKAAKKNYDLSAQFFGLLVYVYFMNTNDSWSSGHYTIKGRDDLGRTYFKLKG
ncbi:hypothetical protein [Solidesulfovibrio sp. C21]|uniref:hypothetical protein n=1 Tax=Solidesulfovibrio sp. C21 TaxID=3398613 RepID=UPI0039FD5B5E